MIPAFNEEESIAAVIHDVLAVSPRYDCLVVDDGSTDRTVLLARDAGALVLSLPFNLGVGGAMRAGFRFARSQGYRQVVQVDADGQHNPANLPELLAELQHADLVLGARFAGSGTYSVRGPRRWAMILLSTILSQVCRTRLTDTTSGFRASGPRAIALFAKHYPAEYLGDTIETLVIAARTGLVVRQLPVAMRERQGGTPSHNPAKAALYLSRAMLALGFALARPASTISTGPRT